MTVFNGATLSFGGGGVGGGVSNSLIPLMQSLHIFPSCSRKNKTIMHSKSGLIAVTDIHNKNIYSSIKWKTILKQALNKKDISSASHRYQVDHGFARCRSQPFEHQVHI